MMKKAIEAFQGGLDALCDKKWFRLYGNCLGALALVVAKYGAGLTWRQVFVGLLVYGLWQSGSEFHQRIDKKPEFQRIQFRISLVHLGQALIDAGIYSEVEVKQNSGALWDCVGRSNCYCITFTWMEQNLFLLNDENRFESRNSRFRKSVIHLKPFGDRALKIGSDFWQDSIELRGRDEFELVLIKSENHEGNWHGELPDDEGPTLTLIKLPWELFRNLQEPLKGHGSLLKRMTDRENRQREILERAGQGKYASLDWETF